MNMICALPDRQLAMNWINVSIPTRPDEHMVGFTPFYPPYVYSSLLTMFYPPYFFI